MKVYLAGPMRGHLNWTLRVFKEYRIKWSQAGHQVFCPGASTLACGYNPLDDLTSKDMVHFLTQAVSHLCAVQAIAMLPGWESSVGASFEVAVSQFLGLKVFDAATMKELEIPKKPWFMLKEGLRQGVVNVLGSYLPVTTQADSIPVQPAPEFKEWRKIPVGDITVLCDEVEVQSYYVCPGCGRKYPSVELTDHGEVYCSNCRCKKGR